MLGEKDKIIAKLRKDKETQTSQISALRKLIQERDTKISKLESETSRRGSSKKGKKQSWAQKLATIR
jgi:hypothetical protein